MKKQPIKKCLIKHISKLLTLLYLILFGMFQGFLWDDLPKYIVHKLNPLWAAKAVVFLLLLLLIAITFAFDYRLKSSHKKKTHLDIDEKRKLLLSLQAHLNSRPFSDDPGLNSDWIADLIPILKPTHPNYADTVLKHLEIFNENYTGFKRSSSMQTIVGILKVAISDLSRETGGQP